MLSDACHDFVYGTIDLRKMIDELDHYEKEHPTIYPKRLIEVLKQLVKAAEGDHAAHQRLALACIEVRNHYDVPDMAVDENGRQLAERLLRRYGSQ